jgi:MFS family permease
MPLGLFRFRNLSAASVIGALWSAAMFAWFFVSALYMQLVLGYTPMQVGLAFLPANLIMAAFSLGLSAKMVMRFGNRLPLAMGLALASAGLALFAFSPSEGSFFLHVLPAMTVLGVGCGMALNPILLVAMGEVDPSESGLASGVVNTAFMMGGSLGLAVLASLSAARTEGLLAAGQAMERALTGGYQLAFVFGAVFAGIAALLSALLLRAEKLAPSYKGA